MAHVQDVAAYILRQKGPMTAMKLQKLVYYAQAWSLVWDEQPLFPERIEAWAMGPVSPDLYDLHRGSFRVSRLSEGDASALTETEHETIDAIIDYYGRKSSHWLSDLSHRESPWKDARKGVAPGARCFRVITHEAMAEYYDSLS
jgi:uncharacterized phage-associated protein